MKFSNLQKKYSKGRLCCRWQILELTEKSKRPGNAKKIEDKSLDHFDNLFLCSML